VKENSSFLAYIQVYTILIILNKWNKKDEVKWKKVLKVIVGPWVMYGVINWGVYYALYLFFMIFFTYCFFTLWFKCVFIAICTFFLGCACKNKKWPAALWLLFFIGLTVFEIYFDIPVGFYCAFVMGVLITGMIRDKLDDDLETTHALVTAVFSGIIFILLVAPVMGKGLS